MKKRLLCLILAALLVAPVFTGCSDNGASSTDTPVSTETATDAAQTETTEETEAEVDVENLSTLEQRALINDNIGEYNFDGKVFSVITLDDNVSNHLFEIVADELTGDTCNDVIYNRNVKVEDRFNAKITAQKTGSPESTLVKMVQAGTNDYSLGAFSDWCAKTAMMGEALYNWYNVTNVNTDMPWHNKDANDQYTVNNTLLCICSDLGITSMTYTYGIFFNVDKVNDLGITPDSLYETVREGKWTLDKFAETTGNIYTDVNGDGQKDKNDIYGFGYEITNPADVWLTACDVPSMTYDAENNILVPNVTSERAVSAYEKIYDFTYNSVGFYKYDKQYDEQSFFLSGNLIFAPLRFSTCFSTLRDMKDTYSILPYPKYDEAQDTYYSNADDKFSVFGFPKTSVADMEFVGTMFEVLCAESYKTVFPVFYDSALKGKYSSDENTAEMVDLIMAGRKFDISFQWGSVIQDVAYYFRSTLKSGKAAYVSGFEKRLKPIAKALDKVMPLYDNDNQ